MSKIVISKRTISLGRTLISSRILINNQRFYSDDSKNEDDDKNSKKIVADSTSKLRNLLQRPQLHQKPLVPPIDLKRPIKKISTSSTTPKSASSSSSTSSSSSSSSSDEEPIEHDLVNKANKAAKHVSNQIKGADDDEKYQVMKKVSKDLLSRVTKMKIENKKNREKSEVAGQPVSVFDHRRQDSTKLRSNRAGRPRLPKRFEEVEPDEKLDAALLENESRRPLSNFRRPRANMMNIFESEETLNIFQPEGLKPDGPEPNQLETWNKCSERANKIILTQPPRNMLEDMVQMTEKGMLWHFPIDNEQGVNEKMIDSFVDHVFLEKHLESWCPEEGPVREFMEVVCTTLSKNAFMTASKKEEYIMWFRDYFRQTDQRDILIASGAINEHEMLVE